MTQQSELTTIRRLIWIALAVVVIIGGAFWQDANRKTDDIVTARTQARIRECHRDNAQLVKAIRRERESWLAFIRHSTGGQPLPPEQQAKVEPFLADQEAAVRDEFSDRAPRPCDTESIKAYYEEATP